MNLMSVRQHSEFLVGWTFETRAEKAKFTFLDASNRDITIRTDSAKLDRRIPVNQIQSMAEQWEDYKAGRVTRTQLAKGEPKNFNTSYLEIIFNEVERQQQVDS